MSLDISSFADRLNSPAYVAGQARKENTRNGLKTNPVKNLDANEGKPDSVETGELDRMGLSANHKVNYKIDQETHKVVIRVVDSESGEVVRQIPGEDFVKLAQRITEFNRKFLDQIT